MGNTSTTATVVVSAADPRDTKGTQGLTGGVAAKGRNVGDDVLHVAVAGDHITGCDPAPNTGPLERRHDRQTADEFGLKTEFQEVFGGDPAQQIGGLVPGPEGRPEPDLFGIQAFTDNLVQAIEGAAHDEQDIAGVNRAFIPFAGFTKLFDFLNHRYGVMGYL